MTESELVSSKLWPLLRSKEQDFLLAYLKADGDIQVAIQHVYEAGDSKTVGRIARKLLADKNVGFLIECIDGEEELDLATIKRLASSIAKKAESDSVRLGALALVARLQGALGGQGKDKATKAIKDLMKEVDEMKNGNSI